MRPRPTSSTTSSNSEGRPQKSTSSPRPSPYGDEVELASEHEHPQNHHLVHTGWTTSTTTEAHR